LALAGAGVVAAGYMVPLALRATRVRETAVLDFVEPFSWPWQHVWSWGPGLVLVAVIGLRAATEPAARGPRRFLIGLAAVWLTAFLALDYGSRLITHWLGGEGVTPFTPSRFLLDLQLVFAIFGGAGLVDACRRLRSKPVRWLFVLGVAVWAMWQVAPRWTPVYSDSFLPIGRWADANLPSDALITGATTPWITYAFHRESTSLFVPISEPVSPRRRLKDQLVNTLGDEPWPEWRERLGRPIYAVGLPGETSWGRPPLVVFRTLAIFELTPETPAVPE
jgi:hypothetical protein